MVHDVACAQGCRAVPLAAARVNSMSEVIYYDGKQSKASRSGRRGPGRERDVRPDGPGEK